MPRTPKGHKRPADVISNAVQIMRGATGEADESNLNDDGKNKAAVALGSAGGKARAKKLGVRRRRAIAKAAAETRWKSNRN